MIPTLKPTSPLRQRMLDDMAIVNRRLIWYRMAR